MNREIRNKQTFQENKLNETETQTQNNTLKMRNNVGNEGKEL